MGQYEFFENIRIITYVNLIYTTIRNKKKYFVLRYALPLNLFPPKYLEPCLGTYLLSIYLICFHVSNFFTIWHASSDLQSARLTSLMCKDVPGFSVLTSALLLEKKKLVWKRNEGELDHKFSLVHYTDVCIFSSRRKKTRAKSLVMS